MSTPAQIDANRANSQLSTGPRTEEGKKKASLNAVKTGLTGRTVLLPDEDIEAYQSHIARAFTKYAPSGDDEHTLVQSIADTEWRLLRIPTLEAGLYALGRREFAAEFADEPEHIRGACIDTRVYQTFRRDFSNLSLQEGRLSRKLEKDRAALEALQAPRLKLEKELLESAVDQFTVDPERNLAFWHEIGFEFSTGQWNRRLACLQARKEGSDHRALRERFALLRIEDELEEETNAIKDAA